MALTHFNYFHFWLYDQPPANVQKKPVIKQVLLIGASLQFRAVLFQWYNNRLAILVTVSY